MNSIKKEDKYYKHKLILLTVVIICSFGYTGYSMIYPPPAYLGEEGTVSVNWMMKNICPYLQDRLDMATDSEGRIAVGPALELAMECKEQYEKHQFENALIREFSRHYE